MEHPIGNLMNTTMDKIKEMVDVNTIVGEPITSPDGTLIIPVSKVSYGFALLLHLITSQVWVYFR